LEILAEELKEILALGDWEADRLKEIEADKLADGLAEILGEIETDFEPDGLAEILFEIEAEGLFDILDVAKIGSQNAPPGIPGWPPKTLSCPKNTQS